MNYKLIALAVACGATLLVWQANAEISPTKQFSISETADFMRGELKSASVLSTGRVQAGVATKRIALAKDPVAYCMARNKAGRLFVGTGDQGRIYSFEGDTPKMVAETGELMVTSIAFNDQQQLFASTVSSGKLYQVDSAGKVSTYAELKGVESIWSLVYDAKKRVLFAGTGPEGKIYSIRGKGQAELYFDSNASHVLSLALQEGELLAGLSDEGLLLRVLGPGKAEVVHDFPADEITAIAVGTASVAVAANSFVKKITNAKKKNSTTEAKKAQERSGKGQLWRIDSTGRVERLLKDSSGYFASVAVDNEGQIYAGSGADGIIYRIENDGSSSVWIDIDERQVLALDMSSADPSFLSSDGAALYRIEKRVPTKSTWTSEVLDAEYPSRWGELSWRSKGVIHFQTRSGNTEKPDDTWSQWSATLSKHGPIRSPNGRFLQIRALFTASADATLLAVQAYYLPQNQRARISSIAFKEKAAGSPNPNWSVSWKVDNPDNDPLRYRLFFRHESHSEWRPILREDELFTKTTYVWDTQSIPDGFYHVKVQASDELTNPDDRALVGFAVSKPMLVDNHPPHLEIKARSGSIEGIAMDAIGPIASLEYAIDGGMWKPFSPVDGLLDTAKEKFRLSLKNMKGEKIVAIRATDAAYHTTTKELMVRP